MTADTASQPRRHGRLVMVVAGLTGLLLAVTLAVVFVAPAGNGPVAADGIGARFQLVDRNGAMVTPETLKGAPYAIFFGFTRCPDVCPTTLSRMTHLRKQMGADGEKFRIVFVSVDSGHDQPADVGAYVDLFATPIIGLTGDAAQIEQAARSFRVYYKKVPVEGGDYTIDHSAFVILMDRDGAFNSVLSDQDSNAAALAELRALVS